MYMYFSKVYIVHYFSVMKFAAISIFAFIGSVASQVCGPATDCANWECHAPNNGDSWCKCFDAADENTYAATTGCDNGDGIDCACCTCTSVALERPVRARSQDRSLTSPPPTPALPPTIATPSRTAHQHQPPPTRASPFQIRCSLTWVSAEWASTQCRARRRRNRLRGATTRFTPVASPSRGAWRRSATSAGTFSAPCMAAA